jgi:hypothetical protein
LIKIQIEKYTLGGDLSGPGRWYFSTIALTYDASAEQFTEAIRSIGLLRAFIKQDSLTIVVSRTVNAFHGYDWQVEMSGSALAEYSFIFPLSVYRQTLTSQLITHHNFSAGNTTMMASQLCWSANPSQPVFAKVLNNGADVFNNDSRLLLLVVYCCAEWNCPI